MFGAFVSLRRQALLAFCCALLVSMTLVPMPRLAFSDERVAFTDQDIANGAILPDVWIGKANAPVTIVEYTLLTCPHCATFRAEVFPKLLTNYIDAGLVRFAYREIPLNDNDTTGWMVARCAGGKRGNVIDLVLAERDLYLVKMADFASRLSLIVAPAGIDRSAIDICLQNDGLRKNIQAEGSYAADYLKVSSAPTFFVNGDRYVGLVGHTADDLENWLGSYLSRK